MVGERRAVCLIWLEFPPPPTWHSPHSPERSGPGVLTSIPSAGLGDHTIGPSGAPGRERRMAELLQSPSWNGASHGDLWVTALQGPLNSLPWDHCEVLAACPFTDE